MTNAITLGSPIKAGISPEFMRRQAPELARDIAAGLDAASELAKAYGLSEAQWLVLKDWVPFRNLLQTAVQEMSGSLGAQERIKRKALMALDQVGVLDAATLSADPKVAPGVRLSALNFLADVAGINAKTQAPGGQGGGPLIVINIPGRAPLAIDTSNAIEVPNND